MYKARVILPDEIIPHPNADNLNLLCYNGLQFIVSKDMRPDQLCVIFFTDGQLSHEFARENNLYRHAELNKDNTKAGYLEDNRRVKMIRLRQEFSWGIVLSLESFAYTGFTDFKQGMEFDVLNNHPICNKYLTPATERQANKNQAKKEKDIVYSLEEHFDTENIQYYMKKLPSPCLMIVTEKVHGTSARTGLVRVQRYEQNLLQRFLSLFGFNLRKRVEKYECVTGTRKTVVNSRPDILDSASQEHYRWQIHNDLSPRLHTGETIYYEIAGYDSFNRPIMNQHNPESLKDKEIIKKYGKTITYNYGTGEGSNPLQRIFVYRITQEDVNGNGHELSWFEIKSRCKDLGLETVPEIYTEYIAENKTEGAVTLFLQENLTNRQSTVGNHLMEGYCLRFESQRGTDVYKAKNPYFLILEGVLKEKDDYVDSEEIS